MAVKARPTINFNRSYSTRFMKRMEKPKSESVVLLNGSSLAVLLAVEGQMGEELKQNLASVFKLSKSIILYRASPSDKAELIKFVKKYCKD